MTWESQAKKVAELVAIAPNGLFVGNTRLQKTVYLLQATGWNGNFSFCYYHYGPYSEDLADAMNASVALGIVQKEEKNTAKGNYYFVYTKTGSPENIDLSESQQGLLAVASEANAIELELAVTALYLYKEEKNKDPWEETKRRKPQKAEGNRLDKARKLYGELQALASDLLPVF